MSSGERTPRESIDYKRCTGTIVYNIKMRHHALVFMTGVRMLHPEVGGNPEGCSVGQSQA